MQRWPAVGGLPVKLAPKTRSSGFRSLPGFAVLVILSLVGSMSCGLDMDAASGLMLYNLASGKGRGGNNLAGRNQVLASAWPQQGSIGLSIGPRPRCCRSAFRLSRRRGRRKHSDAMDVRALRVLEGVLHQQQIVHGCVTF